ncbi:MAG: type IV secretory system conjugative DNA transfer family protein [Clostridia bacterium]|nr:type IV secretory system conjugative DNA transfer family protein [Clostridia bacterium]
MTYILTLISAYILVDRIVEFLFIIFTGVGYSYWGPIQYALAFACLAFAFFFSGPSKFAGSDVAKYRIFHTFYVSFYILFMSAVVQWLNQAAWIGLLSLPNYPELATDFFYLFRPAFTAIGVYLPLVTFYKVIKWLVFTVHDTKDIRDSIFDYGGISLTSDKEAHGVYTCEVKVCVDSENGEDVCIPESKRFESFLVVGVSGSGKTTMVYEPMLARDIERKSFFQQVSKEMGFTALKTGLATLSCPYDNDYLNEHFTLDMLVPNSQKLDTYKAYMKRMIIATFGDSFTYRNMGITYISAEHESVERIKKVADNFHIEVNLIDPNSSASPGLNPFIYEDPIKTGVAISSVLKGLFTTSRPDTELAFRENEAIQILENIAILLKEMYSRQNGGLLPNLEDVLNCLTDFELVEHMVEDMKQIPDLAEKYRILIRYFENNFYENGKNVFNTKKSVTTASAELDNLLRYPGVKNILCNRSNNLNYDEILKEGQITLVCTRRGDLGEKAHRAFGLFFILLMQQSILSRPGNDNNRIPHFLYIDDFPTYICPATEPIYTLYRKYKVATVLDSQNLAQLDGQMNLAYNNHHFKETILSNCVNKFIFGNATPEDVEWWQTAMQDKREWKFGNTYNSDKTEYDPKKTNIEYKWIPNYAKGKIMSLKSKQVIYKIKDLKGKSVVNKGKVDFIEAKYKEPQKIKKYDFTKFTNGMAEPERLRKLKQQQKEDFAFTTASNDNYSTDTENDPIKMNNTNNKYFFDTEDAIVVNFKKHENKSEN